MAVELDDLLTPEETARRLRVKTSWIYNRIHARALPFPYLKIGRCLRFRAKDIAQFLEDSTKCEK